MRHRLGEPRGSGRRQLTRARLKGWVASLGGVEPWTRGWRFVLLVWVASRTFFLTLGAIADAFIATAWHENVFRFELPGALSYWAT